MSAHTQRPFYHDLNKTQLQTTSGYGLCFVCYYQPVSVGADREHFLNKQNTPSPSKVGA